MKQSQRFAAVVSCLLLCGSAPITVPRVAFAETAQEQAMPASDAPDAEGLATSQEDQGNASTPSVIAETPDATEQPTFLKDGWHGGSGEPLWYQKDGAKVTSQWLYDNGSWFYLSSDGAALTGVQEIEGLRYCFDDNGHMQVGWALCNGTWYHAKSSGELDAGWLYTGGCWYLLDDDGAMLTGIQSSGNDSYLLQSSGTMAVGWGIDPATGKWCYADASGRLASGWQFVNGAWYLIGKDKLMLTGLQEMNGTFYYLQNSGAMATGWAWDAESGNWYYANSSGSLVDGWQYIYGAWYWLDSQTKAMATGWLDLGSTRYHLSASGAMNTGWLLDDNNWYWLDPTNGDLRTGWQWVNGHWYYMDAPSGRMHTGLLESGSDKYFFTSSGAMASGWAYDESSSCWYLASSDASDGRLLAGWQKLGSTWYYLRTDTYQMFTGWLQEGDALYYLKPSGAMAAGEWIDYIGDTKLYMDANGYATLEMRDGLIYKNRNSNELATGWVKSSDSWLYINPDGSLARAWLAIGGTWYYLDPESGVMHTGWVKVDGLWYWLDSSGAMATGWTTIGSTRWQLDDYTGALHEPEQTPRTDLQRRVVDAARNTPSPGGNLCAMWVSQVFSRAGLGYPEGNACDMFWQWCNQSDLNNLKVGMIVAVPSHTHTYMGGIYGHVCIYIGGGMIMDNVGYVRTMSLNDWLSYYTTSYSPQWGWCNWQALE